MKLTLAPSTSKPPSQFKDLDSGTVFVLHPGLLPALLIAAVEEGHIYQKIDQLDSDSERQAIQINTGRVCVMSHNTLVHTLECELLLRP